MTTAHAKPGNVASHKFRWTTRTRDTFRQSLFLKERFTVKYSLREMKCVHNRTINRALEQYMLDVIWIRTRVRYLLRESERSKCPIFQPTLPGRLFQSPRSGFTYLSVCYNASLSPSGEKVHPFNPDQLVPFFLRSFWRTHQADAIHKPEVA